MKVIHVLRKPCSEPTVAANVLQWGTGALNIDATRIGSVEDVPAVHATRKSDYPQSYKGDGAGWGRTRHGYAGDEVHWEPKGGRWPANLILNQVEEIIGLFPESKQGDGTGGLRIYTNDCGQFAGLTGNAANIRHAIYNDDGSAARFFKQVKP